MPKTDHTYWLIAKRGMLCRCPHCGKGKLYKGYLKQVDSCLSCGAPLGEIRADDGPAWLTMFLLGAIVSPLIFFLIRYALWPDWVSMVIVIVTTIILTLVLLPPIKGLFIAIIWRNSHSTKKH